MGKSVLRLGLTAFLGIVLAGGVAHAQMDDDDDMGGGFDDDMGGELDDDDTSGTMDDGEDGGGAAAGGEMGGRKPLITPKGAILITGGVLINLSSEEVAKPISINPDIFYGAMPKLEVGLVHSPQAFTGFFAGSGGGLCLTGEENGCAEVYDNPGLIARYQVMDNGLDLAVDGGLLFVSLSEFTVALKAGVLGRYVMDKLEIWFNPNLWLGLTDRSVEVMGVEVPINKERLHLPVGVTFAVNEKITVGAQTGIAGFLDGFGDTWAGILSVGGALAVSETLSVGGFFSFDNLYGNEGGADARSLQIAAWFHL